MTPHYSNGEWKGKTDATLASIADSIDELKGQVGLNCPLGKIHSEKLGALELSVAKHHAKAEENRWWVTTFMPFIAGAIGGASQWLARLLLSSH